MAQPIKYGSYAKFNNMYQPLELDSTVTNADGSVTTTTDNSDGSITTTTTEPDGSSTSSTTYPSTTTTTSSSAIVYSADVS